MDQSSDLLPRLAAIARDCAPYALLLLAWAEAVMTVGAAYAKRMMPLRTMAMLGNILGLALGLCTGSLPTILKHAVNFPLNAARRNEMRRLIATLQQADAADLNLEWLKPFMHPRALKAGDYVFARGEAAEEAFIVVEGRLDVPERHAVLGPGDIFGEMALFTGEGLRTASVICVTDARLLVITYEQFEQLYFQNPEFGFYLVRTIVRRFENYHAARETSADEPERGAARRLSRLDVTAASPD